MTPLDLINDTVVFLGPSLSRARAAACLDATYLPPARMGDVYAVLPCAPRRIVLLDGVFHGTRSVWPREILAAMDEGVEVIGASSMGALRAAELHAYGMIGVGRIFEWYRSGILDGDDEVALRHGDQASGYRAMSEPLVNIRATLAAACRDEVLDAEEADAIIQYAKAQYYPDRSYNGLMRSPIMARWPRERAIRLDTYFRERAVPQKTQDALQALALAASRPVLRRARDRGSPSDPSVWASCRHEYAWVEHEGDVLRGHELGERLLADEARCATMRRLAAAAFIQDLARRRGWAAPEPQAARSGGAGLVASDGAIQRDLLAARGLTSAMLARLLRERATVRWILSRGPQAFGLPWDARAAAQLDATLGALRSEGPTGDARAARPFLVAWVRTAGVECPDDEVAALERRARDLCASSAGHPALSDALVAEWARDTATEQWLLRRGPGYFGIRWSGELAALQELQLATCTTEILLDEMQ